MLMQAQLARLAQQLGHRRRALPDLQQLIDAGRAMTAAEVVIFVEGLLRNAMAAQDDPYKGAVYKARALHDAVLGQFNFG